MGKLRKERLDRGIKARCDDVFALSSWREIAYLVAPRAVPVIVLLSFPLMKDFIGLYWEKVFLLCCTASLLALSWDFLASVGLVSLGQALFFGMGAYSAGLIDKYLGLPMYLGIPLGTLIGAFISTAMLIPVLRLRGVYFSIVTLILPLLLQRVIEATKVAGGEQGIGNLTHISSFWLQIYIPLVATLVCLFGFRRLMTEDYGVVLQAIRDNDRTVMGSAINVNLLKTQAIFISALVGCFAGAFMVHYYQFVGISAFSLDYSMLPLTCAVLGGPGSFAGATLGAFILVPLSEALRSFGSLRVTIYSIILMVCIITLPEGIFHYLQRKYHQFERVVEVE